METSERAERATLLAEERGRWLESVDPRFVLEPGVSIPQGVNNRILAGRYDGVPVVFKFYHDSINKPDAARRKEVERFALHHWAGIPEVPRVFAEGDDFLVIERFGGESLADGLKRVSPGTARPLLERVGADCGRLYAQLARRPLDADAPRRLHPWSSSRDPVRDDLEAVLAQARAVCGSVPELGAAADTLAIIESESAGVLREPQRLYRYDNNFGNLIVREERLIGLIDFEQCFPGSESLLLGALLDTLPEIYPAFPNRPSWSVLRAGYERERGEPIDDDLMRRVVAMAMLTHWRRITERQTLQRDLGKYLPRFLSRFPVLRARYEALPA